MAFSPMNTGGGSGYKVAVGTFSASTTSQTVDVGFEPKYLSINRVSTGLQYCLYDADISTTKFKTTASSGSGGSAYSDLGSSSIRLMAVTSTGFEFKVSSSSNADTYRYIAVG